MTRPAPAGRTSTGPVTVLLMPCSRSRPVNEPSFGLVRVQPVEVNLRQRRSLEAGSFVDFEIVLAEMPVPEADAGIERAQIHYEVAVERL